jgi:hypothetical protein
MSIKKRAVYQAVHFVLTWIGRAVYALRKALERVNYRIDLITDYFSGTSKTE